MDVTLDAIRNCLEGVIPAVIATSAPDGTPNVAYLSQVHFVDNAHVALTFQFFNKTRENVLANPRATVQVIDPDTAVPYRLTLEYLRTETDGPLFEYMKAKLAGIASHTGMSKVFRLLGADIYRVLDIDCVPGTIVPYAIPRRSRLAALRACAQRLGTCTDLATALDQLLRGLHEQFEIQHAMVLMFDAQNDRLYTVASHGYEASGVGSELALGAGVIGVAARERTPIRITHVTGDYAYSRAVREGLSGHGSGDALETAIPFPGLPAPHSQLAVPIVLRGRLLGVLYVESDEDLRFTFEDEDALVTLAAQLALAVELNEQGGEAHEAGLPNSTPRRKVLGSAVTIRHYVVNDSVFIGEDYLIKGVAGAIFWKLLRDFAGEGRTDFSNRELRLDPSIRLPDISDNLEARLILLQRRLAEHCTFLGIEKTGRGRFRLRVDRPVDLIDIAACNDG